VRPHSSHGGRWAGNGGQIARQIGAWLGGCEDAAAIGALRILIGAALSWDAARYLAAEWVPQYLYSDRFLFKYFAFEWVTRASPAVMAAVLWVSLVAPEQVLTVALRG
jgi:hypothetical protein